MEHTTVFVEDIEYNKQVSIYTTQQVLRDRIWFAIDGTDGNWKLSHGIISDNPSALEELNGIIIPLLTEVSRVKSLVEAIDSRTFFVNFTRNLLEEIAGRPSKTYAVTDIVWEVDDNGNTPSESRRVVTLEGIDHADATSALLDKISDETGFLVQDCTITGR